MGARAGQQLVLTALAALALAMVIGAALAALLEDRRADPRSDLAVPSPAEVAALLAEARRITGESP